MSNHIGEGHSEGHHDQGFIKTYIFSTDHKMIAKQFLITSLVFLAIGGILAAMIRWKRRTENE